MISLILWVLAFAAAGAFFRFYIFRKREQYIQSYQFPVFITNKVQQKYPHISPEQMAMIITGLRHYFLMCCKAERKLVAMPSQVVDDVWHEFILHTRAYKTFCQKAFGRFLHHTPAEAIANKTYVSDSIKRAWRLACKVDGVTPKTPQRLPLIFALDGMLSIPDGFHYATNCENSPDKYCAAHIGCGGGCAGSSGCSGGDGGCGGD